MSAEQLTLQELVAMWKDHSKLPGRLVPHQLLAVWDQLSEEAKVAAWLVHDEADFQLDCMRE